MLNQQFKKAIKQILNKGIVSNPRGMEIKELLNYSMIIKDPTQIAVNYKSKKFNYKYQLAELLRYLSGDLSIKFIGQYAKLWLDIADKDGNINSNYGYLMFGKLNSKGENQYDYILNTLKKDKDSRQAMGFYNGIWNQVDGTKDRTCTAYNHVFIRNNELHMISSMRSNDLFFGFVYDCIRFALILQSLRLDLLETYPDLKLGKLYYNADSLHIYKRHYDISREILKQKGYNIKLELKTSLRTLYNTVGITETQLKIDKKRKDVLYYKKILSNFINIKDSNGLLKTG